MSCRNVAGVVLAGLLPFTVTHAQTRPSFVFQDSFWLNLHHFMRGEVYRRAQTKEDWRQPAKKPARNRKWLGGKDSRRLAVREAHRGLPETAAQSRASNVL